MIILLYVRGKTCELLKIFLSYLQQVSHQEENAAILQGPTHQILILKIPYLLKQISSVYHCLVRFCRDPKRFSPDEAESSLARARMSDDARSRHGAVPIPSYARMLKHLLRVTCLAFVALRD